MARRRHTHRWDRYHRLSPTWLIVTCTGCGRSRDAQ